MINLVKKFKSIKKSVNHPTQKVKQRVKKTVRHLNKQPLIIRYILSFILIGAGIISLANPLLPGWLFLLIGAKILSPKLYHSFKRTFKKYESKSYQQEIFEILSK